MMDIFAGGVILVALAILIGLWAGRRQEPDEEKKD